MLACYLEKGQFYYFNLINVANSVKSIFQGGEGKEQEMFSVDLHMWDAIHVHNNERPFI